MTYFFKKDLIFFFLFFISFQLLSQPMVYETSKIISNSPKIDGKFDDEAWSTLDWENNFTQFEPHEGEAPNQQTGFKIRYDNDNLYIAIKAFDKETQKVDKRMTRRDGWEGDLVGIQIDSYHDKRTAFVFAVSAAGVKNDGFFSNDAENFDDSWDPIWEVKTMINHDGWNAEMKIPFSQLRFSDAEEQVWGLEVVRMVFRNEETSLWQPISQKSTGWVSNYGELQGIKNIKPKKQIELAPFFLTKFDSYQTEPGNPFADGRDFSANLGLDGKIALTNNFILDLTINPDFGQVEADPSEVNLTAFETYYEEKRPFFIEGNNITNYQLLLGDSPWSFDNLFYSRRIGRSPQYEPELADNEYLEMPENTRILGAVKLTGKTDNGWSVGIIETITRNEKALIDYEGNQSEITVEPMTNYTVARVQKDINNGNTLIGGMATSTNRMIDDEHLEFLTRNAYTGGIDFTQYFNNRKYFLTFNAVFSEINGSKESIYEQQISSRRYFQRPDAKYLSLDTSLTRLRGHGGSLTFVKSPASGFRYAAALTWRSPGLEMNDVGYQRQGDILFHFIWVGYRITKPFGIFRIVDINMNEWSGWDFGGHQLFYGGNTNVNTQFTNFWTFGFGINREQGGISNDLLRGGPSIRIPGNTNFWTTAGTNTTKKFRIEAGMAINWQDEQSARYMNIFGEIIYRPIDALSFAVQPEYSYACTDLQYIDETEVNENSEYLFGSMNQNTLSITSRIDYNITPDLTIQYYGSPFVSGAMFKDFKRITNPMADFQGNRYQILNPEEYGTYGIDQYDFNFRQFRSNLVLRWEYIPGSVVYLVWSQYRTSDVEDGVFDYVNDINGLFSTVPRNIYLIKFSYRIQAEKWLN